MAKCIEDVAKTLCEPSLGSFFCIACSSLVGQFPSSTGEILRLDTDRRMPIEPAANCDLCRLLSTKANDLTTANCRMCKLFFHREHGSPCLLIRESVYTIEGIYVFKDRWYYRKNEVMERCVFRIRVGHFSIDLRIRFMRWRNRLADEDREYVMLEVHQPSFIWPEQIVQWLTHCEANHGFSCSERFHSPHESFWSNILVIDVSKMCISKLTSKSDSYVALSYVWGNDAETGCLSLRLTDANCCRLMMPGALSEETIPESIADAIYLCSF